jgi:hypothetical protein
MRELKMHPKELLLKDGKVQIEDVQGPKGEGSLEARMEELEQEVFRYKKMAEREVDIIHRINQELIAKHKKETAELWMTSCHSMRPPTNYKHNSMTCKIKTVSMRLGLNK